MEDYEKIRQAFWDLANLRDSLRYKEHLPTYIRDMNDVDINNAMFELSKALKRLELVNKN